MSMQTVKLGFVILSWNSERVIETCLRSIIDMKTFQTEIVVADNGSTDDTVRIIERLIDSNGRYEHATLRLLRYDRNLGTTVPRNAGLRALEGFAPDYYCILDSDTVVNEDAFRTLIREMEAHPEYGLIGPAMISADGKLQSSARAFPTLTEKLCKAVPLSGFQRRGEALEKAGVVDSGTTSGPVDYLQSACWLFRPQLLENAGYLDEHIFYAPEDAEYCIRVWKSGYQVAYCPETTIIHEWQRLSRKKYFSRLNWEHIRGLAHMFRKHGYLLSAERLRKTFP